MIDSSAALAMALLSLGMVLTPGPNMLYLLSRTVSQGTRAGLVSLGGVAAGFACYLVAATAGSSALFAAVPVAYDLLRVAGVCYLAWLAWKTVRGTVDPVNDGAVEEHSRTRLFASGLVTNLLNPKIALMYLAVIPQFVDTAGAVWAQSLALGSVQIGVALVGNASIVFAAGTVARALRARPAWQRLQRRLTATALGTAAVFLASDRTRPGAA
ncbi:LysE family translocator [Rhodococcus sp. HNM0569]|uniref:LysE family translocator n=1 Tax=Rhodococcus sp. HNM0569 TaxID=2716340 RepID=UPI00146AC0DA|nr:LysE family translocator [Rhodococcus sp. HNM0569]NLU82393.1 LysE family translocator [Rhodococcus sp. HNM0569]